MSSSAPDISFFFFFFLLLDMIDLFQETKEITMYNCIINSVGIFISQKGYDIQEKADLKYEKCFFQREKCLLHTAQNTYLIKINQVGEQPKLALVNKTVTLGVDKNTFKMEHLALTSPPCTTLENVHLPFYNQPWHTDLTRGKKKSRTKEIKVFIPLTFYKGDKDLLKNY